jgi:D-alanyl-lipoteichoic acid acyltransferase DltB (MBOAT superfamily)
MLFNTLQFVLFFALVLAVHRALPRGARNGWLLAASLIFYSLWVPAYLVLLLGDIVVNFILLRRMARSARPRPYLVAILVFTFGLLACFKYAAFLVESALPLLKVGFGFELPVPDVLLPIGISFYSFQIVALAVDTYRGSNEPPQSLSRYTLFVCFFPQLIAGPILRGHQFLPQLESGGDPSRERTRKGLWLIATGTVKKVVLADFALAPYVDNAFGHPGVGTSPEHLIAAYSFAFQIYFDFSGYCDMARGMAYLLGYDLPLNFREPYLSRNPVEFWRRWHITLSRWLRDYLYIPLGGNRAGSVRTHANLLITMLIGGLWHGAGWTFVVWGGLHGILLVGHRLLGRTRAPESPLRWTDAPRVLLFFHAVCLLWVFFRAPSFSDALIFLGTFFSGTGLGQWPVLQSGVVLLCAGLHLVERYIRIHIAEVQREVAAASWGPPLEGVALGAVIGLALAVAGAGGQFIYFQF